MGLHYLFQVRGACSVHGYESILTWASYSDIFVDAEGVVELLHSRDGDYDMVCAFDYAQWGVTDGVSSHTALCCVFRICAARR